MRFNKSLVTNLVALIVLLLSWVIPAGKEYLFSTGLFALAGAVTNWLAVHMLFEKVPFLYGSGVIPSRFEEFKVAIKKLVMQQFFSKESIAKHWQGMGHTLAEHIDKEAMANAISFEPLYQNLVDTIMASPFGGMLNMAGGVQMLAPLKEPIIRKLKESVIKLFDNEKVIDVIASQKMTPEQAHAILQEIERLVDQRLEELTPQMVKEIVKQMIREHLGWLVVWGGVFGGLIGLVAALVQQVM